MSGCGACFSPDPRIAADSVFVIDLTLCQVRLMDDSRFPWLILLPRRAGAVEITDLDAAGRQRLMDEIALACAALKAVAPCDKLNVGALGNVVSQLHVHVVARSVGDAAWPGPVWAAGVRQLYPHAERESRVAAIRAALAESVQAGV